MQKPGKIIPILIGALMIVVISSFPVLNFINFFFCAGVIAGSIAGVYYYNKKLVPASLPLTYKDGAIIGGVSGFLGAVISIIIVIFAVLLLKILNIDFASVVEEIFRKFGLPAHRSGLSHRMIDEYREHGFSITHIILVTIAYGITYPLFGIIGGIIGTAYFNKKRNKTMKV